MKKMFRTACAVAAFVSVIGLLSSSVNAQDDAAWQKIVADGKKEGAVTAVSTVMKGRAAVDVMKAFKDQDGISLEFFPGRVGAAIEKIITEQKSKSYVTDTMDTHGTEAVALKKAGYLQNVAASLPALKDKDKFSIGMIDDPEGQLINVAGESTYICINTNLVKPEDEPKSYQDLLDPKWKGKIILLNPVYNSSPDQLMLGLTEAKVPGIDEDYFKKLYQSAVVGGPGGSDEAMDKLVRGEFAIGGFFSSGIALKPIRAGGPIKVLDLKEGYVFKTARIAALANMPHPNATRVYFNWLLTKEGQALMTKETDLEPLRTDVPPTLPFTMKGPRITLTNDDQTKLEERASQNYMANLLGLKK